MSFKKKLKQIFESDFEDDWGDGIPVDDAIEVLGEFKINEKRMKDFLVSLLSYQFNERDIDISDLLYHGYSPIKDKNINEIIKLIALNVRSEDRLRNFLRSWDKSGWIDETYL